MKKRTIAVVMSGLAAALCVACGGGAESSQNRVPRTLGINSVIPVPVSARQDGTAEAALVVDGRTAIVCGDTALAKTAEYLAQKLRTATGYDLKITGPEAATVAGAKNYILLAVNDTVAGGRAEGYRLVASAAEQAGQGCVTIEAAAPAGAFYGVQTLLQLLPPEVESPKRIRGIE